MTNQPSPFLIYPFYCPFQACAEIAKLIGSVELSVHLRHKQVEMETLSDLGSVIMRRLSSKIRVNWEQS